MKKGALLAIIVVLALILTAGVLSAESGGEQLYKHRFISGSDPKKMVLNEDQMLTREQLALLILELNGLADEPLLSTDYFTFYDTDKIAEWAQRYIIICLRKGLMKGESSIIFNPKGQVTGKQLGAVMLRALGYQNVPWEGVEKKLTELNIPIKDEPLTRGQAFDYMWHVVNQPLLEGGISLGNKLGKVMPGVEELKELSLNKLIQADIPWEKSDDYIILGKGLLDLGDKYQLLMANDKEKKFYIFTLSKDWKVLQKEEKSYTDERFAAFYPGKEYYYIVFGNNNEEEDDNKAVIRLVKYDKNFNELASLDIKNAYTSIPFRLGNIGMAERDGHLVIHTARLRYLTPHDGLRHQSQLTIVVDTENMRVLNDLGAFQINHVSHSFNQFAFYDDRDRLVLFDHGDGDPRSIVIQVLRKDGRLLYTEGDGYNQYGFPASERKDGVNFIQLLRFPGDIGENETGTRIGGVVSTPSNYLMATSRMDYSKDFRGEDRLYHNIYVDIINKNDFRYITKQLTFDADKRLNYAFPITVYLENGRFMVIWYKLNVSENYTVQSEMQYLIMDEEGEIIHPTQTLRWHNYGSMYPIYEDGKVFWLETDYRFNKKKDSADHYTKLYTIDVDPAWLK